MEQVIERERLIDFDIRPKAGIMGVFSRLSYKHEYAIAEFVDNSTQSFFSNEKMLNSHGIYKLKIQIAYDDVNKILIIKDNAFGMNIYEFQRALLMDKLPTEQNTRNEFGMGLKTAASWFGTEWSVESTAFGSFEKYYSKVDIQMLRETEENNIQIKIENTDRYEHGTRICIKNVTKRMSNSNIRKVKDLLSSMYRRDITSNKVEIFFNGEKLNFKEYEPLEFRNRVWKKEINFNFKFEEKIYNVKGFVGILKEGSYKQAGLALFRRNRMVVGGDGQNYKPTEIYIQVQNNIALKLYGEIDLDDFEINQAKDGFIWNEGLEEVFLENLKIHIKEYIKIATIKKADILTEIHQETVQTEEYSDKIQDSVNKSLKLLKEGLTNEEKIEYITNNIHIGLDDLDENEEQLLREYTTGLVESEGQKSVTLNSRDYNVPIDKYNTQKYKMRWVTGNNEYWLEVAKDNKDILIDLNINHPFFKPYSNTDEFKIMIEKFVISLVLSQEKSLIPYNDDILYINPDLLRKHLNKILLEMSRI